jgi:hypothetical protein
MNASIRSLFVFILLLLLMPTVEASAQGRSSSRGSKTNRYSIVELYKDAYAKPRAHRGLFGKRKSAGHNYARTHRTHSW